LKKSHIPGVGKLVQWESHWQKNKNTSEPQNQFVLSNTVRQGIQVLHKMTYSNRVDSFATNLTSSCKSADK